METKKEMEEASKLFGEILKKVQAGPELTLEDLDKLVAPIDPSLGIINVFCFKDHVIFPISEEGRADLLERSGEPEPKDWTGKYFHVSGCPFCTGSFENPTLKDFRVS